MANDTRQTLDIPNSATFELKDGRLVVGNEGDVVLRGSMGGFKFQKVFSRRGNIQLIPPDGVELDVDEIEAPAGDLYIMGRVRARSTKAKTVHFQEGSFSADIIEAKEEVVLSGKKLNILHVKAPKVTVDQDAEGTLMVVESQNDIGRCKAMGGFRSLEAARTMMEQFQRLTGAPLPASSAAIQPPIARAEPLVDLATTQSSASTVEMPVLPKSSVFRKRT